MFTFLFTAITNLVGVYALLSDQLGFSSAGGQRFWLFAAEAFILTALVRWILSAFNVRPLKALVFWIAVPLLVLATLLQVNRIANPPRSRPNLQAQIDGMVFGDLVQDGVTKVLVVPSVSIRNTGEASIAEHFDLALHLPDGSTVHGDRQTMPARLEVPFPDGSAFVVFGEDSLDRHSTLPIQRGGTVRGRLAFQFPPLTSEQLKAEGVFCQLTMVDGWGQSYATQMTAAGPAVASAGDLRDSPGLRSETRAPVNQSPAAATPKQR